MWYFTKQAGIAAVLEVKLNIFKGAFHTKRIKTPKKCIFTLFSSREGGGHGHTGPAAPPPYSYVCRGQALFSLYLFMVICIYFLLTST